MSRILGMFCLVLFILISVSVTSEAQNGGTFAAKSAASISSLYVRAQANFSPFVVF